jgi:flagellar biosynthesis protein FlhB
MAGDRTEKPTAKRVRDARRKGQMARSRDVETTAQLVAVLIAFAWAGPWMVRSLADGIRRALERVGQRALLTIEPGELAGLAVDGAATIASVVGPVALAAGVATIGAATLQGGWNVAPEALRFKWSRLSPTNGLKRLAPSQSGINLVKTLVGLTAVGWVAWRVVRATLDTAIGFGGLPPAQAAHLGWKQVERLLRDAAVVFVFLAAADYGVQRWRHGKSLRMTKQEVRDDTRLTEGSPETKARVRRVQREMARRRMLAAVPSATVVVTNPTEYAVALEYHRDTMTAPRVVAKGKDLLAARIRAIAREHGVPLVENVPLAQSLYKSVHVGERIPADLFGAVAEVLAYLVRLKQLTL